MRNLTMAVLAMSVLSVGAGCSVHRRFTYPLDPIMEMSRAKAEITVAVLPARDIRGSSNNMATVFLSLVPLCPYGFKTYERPETAMVYMLLQSFDANITEDIPKAIAQHLQQSGAVRRAFFDYGGGARENVYVMETTVKRTDYKATFWTYMVAPLSPYLWLLGAPIGRSHMWLEIDLSLKNPAGRETWKASISERWKLTQGFYYGLGRDMEGLARCLQRGLDQALRKKPIGG